MTARALLLVLACLASSALLGPVSAKADDAKHELTLPEFGNTTDDLDAMLKRHRIRILVAYSKTQYFLDKGRSFGITVNSGHQLEAELNKRYGVKRFRISVAFIPTSRERLIPDLIAGRGDIVAGSLTVTPERAAQADFVAPWTTDVKEILVTGPASPSLTSIDDLAGKAIRVRKSSSYYAHLAALSDSFVKRGLAPITIDLADDDLEDEDLMEMVNAGLSPYAVVDDFKAKIWAAIFAKLAVREDLAISTGGSIAWAVRKNNPQLKTELDKFVATNKIGTLFGNIVKQRYYGDATVLKSAYAPADLDRFNALVAIFNRYGAEYNFDPLMMGAQGYQESQLDQSKRSPRGAVGVMQLLPSTAKEVGVAGIDKDADANIRAGVLYMRLLAQKYLNDPALDAKNRALMTFAAYNAGPGNLMKFRQMATRDKLDPNLWFGNVEEEAAKVVGVETTQYVGNIYRYFVAYTLYLQRKAEAAAAKTAPDVK